MAITNYSHAFLVGSFNGELQPNQLSPDNWKISKLSQDEYRDRISDYYQSLIDSMVEAEGQKDQHSSMMFITMSIRSCLMTRMKRM